MNGYPGSKASEGVYQHIISRMPPHEVYIEPFYGTGFILNKKRPALLNVGLDLDPLAPGLASGPIGKSNSAGPLQVASSADFARATALLASSADAARSGGLAGHSAASGVRISSQFVFAVCDAIEFLRAYPWTGRELVYCDPPYLRSTRKSKGAKRTRAGRFAGTPGYYNCEMMTQRSHVRLLDVLVRCPAMVMISGYWSKFYGARLRRWHASDYTAPTRGGTVREWLWCNFPPPLKLHDYRFLGKDKREREKIRRRITRLRAKLAAQPLLERQALLAAVAEYFDAGNGG